MEYRLRSSYQQFSVMLEFMETHGDLSRPLPGLQGRINNENQWKALTELLNGVRGGVRKPLEKWKRVWSDWKTKTKKKAIGIKRNSNGTEGASKRKSLNPLEERVLRAIGVGSITGAEEVEESDFEAQPSPIIVPVPVDTVILDPAHTSPNISPSPVSISETHEVKVEDPFMDQRESVTSPETAATPPSRRLRVGRRRRRRETPFEKAFGEFVQIEKARLRQEERRTENEHEREMERLRVETLRIQMEERRTVTFERIANAVQNLVNLMH